MNWKLGGLAAFFLVAVLVLGGCGSGGKQAVQQSEVVTKPVAVAAVQQGEVQRVNTVAGKVAAALEVNVVPRLGGKVAEVPVRLGDRVKAGQMLVRLDTTETAVQVRQAEAGVASALANLANLEAGTRSEQLEQAKQGVEMAQAQAQAASDALARMRYLFEQGGISQAQLDSAQTQARVAEAQLAQAQASLLMARNGPTAEVLDIARAQVRQAEAALELAQTQLTNSVVTAPVAGQISARYIEPGEMAAPTMPVVTIVQADQVTVEAGVTEDYINKLQVGETVAVVVQAAGPAPLIGKLAGISPAADARTGTYSIKIDLPNPDGRLKPGMTAAIPLVLESRKNVLVVPLQAVLERDGKRFVFVVLSGVASRREVTVGLEGEREAAIATGLTAGEQVVVSGQHLLSDGDRVTLPEGGK